ncbi:MAG: hypothetical protein ACQERT_14315 [Thermodesulfobacteriota bacterium]
MKHKGRFQKVSAAAKRMYGPKALLMCGYPQDEHEPFLTLTSEAWTLQELLSELEMESRAMRGKKGS